MQLRKEEREALLAQVEGKLQPGDGIYVAGYIGLSGMEGLLKEREAELRDRFSPGFFRRIKAAASGNPDMILSLSPGSDLIDMASASVNTEKENNALAASQKGRPVFTVNKASSLISMGRGGFLTALWKMAAASGVGLEVNLRAVPIRQETIEVCDVLDEDPFHLDSTGAWIIGASDYCFPAGELKDAGFTISLVGRAVEGSKRILRSGEIERYLERPPYQA